MQNCKQQQFLNGWRPVGGSELANEWIEQENKFDDAANKAEQERVKSFRCKSKRAKLCPKTVLRHRSHILKKKKSLVISTTDEQISEHQKDEPCATNTVCKQEIEPVEAETVAHHNEEETSVDSVKNMVGSASNRAWFSYPDKFCYTHIE